MHSRVSLLSICNHPMNNLSNKICVPNSTEDLAEVVDADADAETISNDEAK